MSRQQSSLSWRRLLSTLPGPLLAIAVVSLILSFLVNRLLETAHWGEHAQRVITQALRVEKLAIDMETGVRGFQISRDAEFLEPHDAAGGIRCEMAELKVLVSDNPNQTERVGQIQAAFDLWDGCSMEALQRVKSGQDGRGSPIHARAKALMDDLRREIGWFLEQEEALQTVRRQELVRMEEHLGLYRIALLALAGLSVAWYLFARLRFSSKPSAVVEST